MPGLVHSLALLRSAAERGVSWVSSSRPSCLPGRGGTADQVGRGFPVYREVQQGSCRPQTSFKQKEMCPHPGRTEQTASHQVFTWFILPT